MCLAPRISISAPPRYREIISGLSRMKVSSKKAVEARPGTIVGNWIGHDCGELAVFQPSSYRFLRSGEPVVSLRTPFKDRQWPASGDQDTGAPGGLRTLDVDLNHIDGFR